MSSFFVNPDVAIVLTGLLVAVASAMLGTFLVLRRSSMLSDAISHAILLGIVLVYLLTRDQYSPFFIAGAALAGLATVALSELLVSSKLVKNDAAIGLVYLFSSRWRWFSSTSMLATSTSTRTRCSWVKSASSGSTR